MTTKSKQRVHDVLAALIVIALITGVAVGVVDVAEAGCWAPLGETLMAGAIVALMWTRTALANEAWREGYRQATDDLRQTVPVRSANR